MAEHQNIHQVKLKTFCINLSRDKLIMIIIILLTCIAFINHRKWSRLCPAKVLWSYLITKWPLQDGAAAELMAMASSETNTLTLTNGWKASVQWQLCLMTQKMLWAWACGMSFEAPIKMLVCGTGMCICDGKYHFYVTLGGYNFIYI